MGFQIFSIIFLFEPKFKPKNSRYSVANEELSPFEPKNPFRV